MTPMLTLRDPYGLIRARGPSLSALIAWTAKKYPSRSWVGLMASGWRVHGGRG